MENIAPETLKRNRRIAVMFGLVTIIALLSLVYAFVQKGIADERMQIATRNAQAANKNAKLADSLRIQLSNCAEAARVQQQMAEQATEQALQAQRQAEVALHNALKK